MVGHMFEACKRDHHLKGISERTRHWPAEELHAQRWSADYQTAF